MSWVTLDDAAPLHRKQLEAGPAACWMWTCGLAYCDRQEAKDGFIPDAMVKLLYPKLGKKEAEILVRVGLWTVVQGGYQVHDYQEWRSRRWGPAEWARRGGKVSSDAKKQAAKDREERKREVRELEKHNPPQQKAQPVVAQDAQPVVAQKAQAQPKHNHNSDPIRSEREKIPPTPRAEEPERTRRPDRFMGSFAALRQDALDLHAEYKRTFGLSGHVLSGVTDLNYITLCEAIDAHGVNACMAALSVAKADSWVNGEADDKGQRHEKISYVFGNPDTLARLLRAAEAKARKARSVGALEQSMNAKPDLSDYQDPPEVRCPPQ